MSTLTQKITALRTDRQMKNSLYLLVGSLATAGFGFIFWIIAARLFDPPTVGIATVLVSLSSLISLLSLAGFDSSFVRFLPRSQHKNAYINSGMVVTTALSIILSCVFLVISYFTTPDLRGIISSPLIIVLFTTLTVASSLNLLTNSVFIAHREAGYIVVINTVFNIVKVILPFAFIPYGSVGVFVAAGAAQAVGLVLSLYYMHVRYNYRPRLAIDSRALRQTFSYTFGVYVGSVLNLLPPTLLPLIITQQLGAASTAYYYMAFNIVTIIFTVAYSAMQSAFAESAHDETKLRQNVLQGIKSSLFFTIPAIAGCLMLGSHVLGVFGHAYAQAATPLLWIMGLSAVAVTLYSALGAVLKIAHDTTSFIATNVAYVLVIVVGSYLLMPQYGLLGIGYAWFAGNIIAIIVGGLCHVRYRRTMTITAADTAHPPAQ
ncbi:oligosaccharide flippase family protein [Candidatus Mycosynbacter amalyticus]|uniref:Oligosaccharide flippase family protein n=1 Tax=Candidatus Mycosynbacter amalyticus TaxID=2665156 RepID=A0A857MR15_9BACT|nr:oligosaccharide flippase family protein [Candidatus Mycosynbacter amalyticus]QHN43070.1 oligosaccharide flippase family protein [Candidatus Mycosynbacter amalyticus]